MEEQNQNKYAALGPSTVQGFSDCQFQIAEIQCLTLENLEKTKKDSIDPKLPRIDKINDLKTSMYEMTLENKMSVNLGSRENSFLEKRKYLDRPDGEKTLSSRETYELIFGESNNSNRQITSKLYNLRTFHGLEPIPGSRPFRYSLVSVKKYINNDKE